VCQNDDSQVGRLIKIALTNFLLLWIPNIFVNEEPMQNFRTLGEPLLEVRELNRREI
jgi:hypothetical protein